MKVIVDAFGGDNAPKEVLLGCKSALEEYQGVEIILVGDKKKIKSCANRENIDISKMEIAQADDVFDIHMDPLEVRKSMANSSMTIGLKMLAGGDGDAFLSAGSTGALMVGASTIVKRINGIKRAALAPVMPSYTGCFMLLDGGANLDCRSEMLQQFGVMGSIYMNKIMEIKSPRVAIANVGGESTKGTELQIEAYKYLKDTEKINFIGNIEARDIPLGGCDVVATDGFSGNMILKATEGMGIFINRQLKSMFSASLKTKLAYLLMRKQMKALKNNMDYTEYGGAPLMGISKPVIKAHGSSNANAFKNAIRQCKQFFEQSVVEEISISIGQLKKV